MISKGIRYLIVTVKLLWLRFFRIGRFEFSFCNSIAFGVGIEVERHSKLCLGKNVALRKGVALQSHCHGDLVIDDNVFMNMNCLIACHKKIYIGKNTMFGPGVMVFDHDHDYTYALSEDRYKEQSVIIGDNVWIGANTVILRGTTIGANSVVGAGCVLKGTYPSDSLIIQKKDDKIIPIEK